MWFLFNMDMEASQSWCKEVAKHMKEKNIFKVYKQLS